jgi:hypothetical protein
MNSHGRRLASRVRTTSIGLPVLSQEVTATFGQSPNRVKPGHMPQTRVRARAAQQKQRYSPTSR